MSSTTKFFTRYNHCIVPPYKSKNPSKTLESFLAETDINNIVNGLTYNTLPERNIAPHYDDFTQYTNLEEMARTVADAKNKFESLNPLIRARFDNNPQKLVDFVSNPEKNYEEGLKLGIFKPKVSDFGDVKDVVTPNVETANAVTSHGLDTAQGVSCAPTTSA